MPVLLTTTLWHLSFDLKDQFNPIKYENQIYCCHVLVDNRKQSVIVSDVA